MTAPVMRSLSSPHTHRVQSLYPPNNLVRFRQISGGGGLHAGAFCNDDLTKSIFPSYVPSKESLIHYVHTYITDLQCNVRDGANNLVKPIYVLITMRLFMLCICDLTQLATYYQVRRKFQLPKSYLGTRCYKTSQILQCYPSVR